LLSVDHGVSLSVLLAGEELLTALGLLLLLNQVTEGTAAGKGNIGQARSLESVLVTDVRSLHGFWDPVKTNAHGGEEEKALKDVRITKLDAPDKLTEVLIGS
jgi:hypothetical protein